jgi:hypothetical protein
LVFTVAPSSAEIVDEQRRVAGTRAAAGCGHAGPAIGPGNPLRLDEGAEDCEREIGMMGLD